MNDSMEFLSNTFDPNHENAKMYLVVRFDQTREEAWRSHLRWLDGKIIGDPQPSDRYTTEQLKAMNIVGVYKSIPQPVTTG